MAMPQEARQLAFALASRLPKEYLSAMYRFFDMDDRARLPWRFYGATVSILAQA